MVRRRLCTRFDVKAASSYDQVAEYLKAVWPDFLAAFLRSGRHRVPGRAFKKVGDEAPHIFEGLPGPPGPARP